MSLHAAQTDPSFRLWRHLVVLGCTAWLLHALNLHYVFAYGRTVGTDYSLGADSPVYRGMAEAWSAGRRADPMYRERVLVPALLMALRRAGFSHLAYPWLVSVLVGPAVMAVGWLAWLITGRARAAYTAATMAALYPTAYQYGVLVETDALHLYLAVLAFGATVAAKREGECAGFLLAAIAWLLTHLVRPALWGIGLVLPWFFWPCLKARTTRPYALIACLSALVVPLTFSAANYARWGMATPSLHTAEILFVWTRSRVHAVAQSEKGGADWTPAVRDAVAAARQDPRWAILHGAFDRDEEFVRAYRSVLSESREYLLKHKRIFFKTTLGEFLHQCSAPLRYYHHYNVPSLEFLYPSAERFFRLVLKLGWWFGLCGWASMLRGRNRDVAWLMLAVTIVNFAPSSLSCWAGARIRMVTDVLGIPVICAGLAQPAAWLGLGLLVLIGYVPRKLGASAAYFNATTIFLGAGAMAWLAARNRRDKPAEPTLDSSPCKN